MPFIDGKSSPWILLFVKIEKMFSKCIVNASSQRNNLIKLTHYDETKKSAHDLQTINISSHELFCDITIIWITDTYLPSTTPFYASVSKGAVILYHFYTLCMVRPPDSNPRPPAPKADALPTGLSGRLSQRKTSVRHQPTVRTFIVSLIPDPPSRN